MLQRAQPERFRFGENWARFVQSITDEQIDDAVSGLGRLLAGELAGRSFLDIGSGSGLSSLAALRLGASRVHAIDIDEDSVSTTRSFLTSRSPSGQWSCEKRSIFDLRPPDGRYDIVYSWGVLHHTGSLWTAISQAASMVKPGGLLVIAIYRKTPLCRFWRWEKRFYARGSRWYRAAAETILVALMICGLLATRRNPVAYIRRYGHRRGMTYMTDVRDWLGGYPYESASPEEVIQFLSARQFTNRVLHPCNTSFGLLGVGCDEYIFRSRISEFDTGR